MQQPAPSSRQSMTTALGWTRSSYVLLSIFVATLIVIGVVWWPLVETYLATYNPDLPVWVQIDWLLLGNFSLMSILIMAGADLKTDFFIMLIGLGGGLAIEGWGTQTELWVYYTIERPPLWIIPAWPIANLSVERLVRLLQRWIPDRWDHKPFSALYWLVFPAFFAMMMAFVWPTRDKSLTVLALVACALMIAAPTDHRRAVLMFTAGSGLGYFLELWGTTRTCWTYYTQQTPPLFAVLAHGFAAVAFWRSGLLIRLLGRKLLCPGVAAEGPSHQVQVGGMRGTVRRLAGPQTVRHQALEPHPPVHDDVTGGDDRRGRRPQL
jgi:hypothetical protein